MSEKDQESAAARQSDISSELGSQGAWESMGEQRQAQGGAAKSQKTRRSPRNSKKNHMANSIAFSHPNRMARQGDKVPGNKQSHGSRGPRRPRKLLPPRARCPGGKRRKWEGGRKTNSLTIGSAPGLHNLATVWAGLGG